MFGVKRPVKQKRKTTMSKTGKISIPETPVKSTPPIKFKDKPGRGGIEINFLRDFGFTPSSIIIQKVYDKNNTIIVSAPKPKSMIKAEELAAEVKIADLKDPGKKNEVVESKEK